MFQKREGQILKKKKSQRDCDLHLTPDEKDVQVDGGEDKEGNGYEEEKDVPGQVHVNDEIEHEGESAKSALLLMLYLTPALPAPDDGYDAFT